MVGRSDIECPTCGARDGACLATCVVCGAVDCGGIARWACHSGPATDPVCRGPCWRKYEAERSARETEATWMAAFARWA